MSGFHTLKLGTDNSAHNLIVLDFGRGHSGFIKSVGHDVIVVSGLYEAIIKGGTDTDGHVSGEGPCCGRPNYKIGVVKIGTESLKLSEIIGNLEFDIDRMAGILGIFDFGLGKRGVALGAPINRLE